MESKKISRFEKMTTAPVEHLVVELAVPAIITMLISAMYNMADTYFVGSIGTSATAGVGITFSLMAIIQAVGFFFGHGSGNYISRALGAQKQGDASTMASTGFFTAFGIGVVIAILGMIFLQPLAKLLGATDTIMPYALDYLRFILPGAPFLISSFMLNNLLRYQGAAAWAMIGMVSGAVLNIGLDPLFIRVFHMGVKGAALATMISQIVSASLLFFVGCFGGNNVKPLPRNFTPRFALYKEMVRGGVPSLLRQSLMSVGVIIMNRTAGAYSDAVIASISVVNRIIMMSAMTLMGIGQGFQPVCGFNYGAKLYGRVKKAFWFCVKVTTTLLSIMSVILYCNAPAIIAAFRRNDPEVIALGTFQLRLMCFVFPTTGWVIMNQMALQTTGNAIPASILSFSRQGCFLIPFLFILPRFAGVRGIQICNPLADFCTFLLTLPLGIWMLRSMKDAPIAKTVTEKEALERVDMESPAD